ncbi:MAG: PQQ-dependent sugar dehydrogenase [Bdellovibrionales bacterium]
MRLILSFLCLCFALPVFAQDLQRSQHHAFKVVLVADALEFPWGMAFLPSGDVLVTEKPGRLLRVDVLSGEKNVIDNVPNVAFEGQGGLLDVMVHPHFENNQEIFLSYSAEDDGRFGTEAVRARLKDDALVDVERIFVADPKVKGGRHFGSRFLWGEDDKVYITLGDRGQRHFAQDPSNHIGSTIRINPDGSIPEDNPFVGHKTYRPEIFTYGNRNVQGIALYPDGKDIWSHEHGPRGGDEVNILKSGGNYGWPEVTYGREYYGLAITDQRSAPGMVDSILHWTPSIAPCGMAFYTGDAFDAWRGDVFVGSLKDTHLRRLDVNAAGEIIGQEILLQDMGERIRDVENGPDGFLYVLSDSHDAQLLRLEPQ